MKITSFNPLIVTKDAQAAVKLFEDLGFHPIHNIEVTARSGPVSTVCLENDGGFRVDVSEAPVPQDLSLIRMNVDDFDEALAFLEERGFRNHNATGATVDTATNKSAMIVSPSGYAFDLCQHLK